jgi:glycosyltransferase involved in cell wall biosynthesis
MPIRIPVCCLDWHIHYSPALLDLLIEPLGPFMRFELIGWDGKEMPAIPMETLKVSPIIFFQLPPPESWLKNPYARLVWIPMWDHAYGYDLKWWQSLPKNLRIMAFSNRITKLAEAVGLRTLSIRYFKNPDELERANWDGKRVLFYWNRTGLVGPGFLSKICRTMDIDLLLFRTQIDPSIPMRFEYRLPKKLGKTEVREIPEINVLLREEYLDLINQANIFIAPRRLEGVGITFIEALARGCLVFAYDAPTMNEYIRHGINGYLFSYDDASRVDDLWNRLGNRVQRYVHFTEKPQNDARVIKRQNWKAIRRLDMQRLGDAARLDQTRGFATWQSEIPQYARFILEW